MSTASATSLAKFFPASAGKFGKNLYRMKMKKILRFSRSSHIPDHMRASHGAPKLECNVCERKFNSATHLKRHMRNVHKIEPELKQAVLKN